MSKTYDQGMPGGSLVWTLVAWHAHQMPAIFIRGIVLPPDMEGTISNIWDSDEAPSQENWTLLTESRVTL